MGQIFPEYFHLILSIISSMLLMQSYIIIGPVENAAPKRIVLPNPKHNIKDMLSLQLRKYYTVVR